MSKIKSCAWSPGLAITGILALWENESRFNYYEAARDATQISSPHESSCEPISFTGRLDTDIPISGDYIERFVSYHKVSRRAAIYSWHKGKNSEGHTTWELGWHSRLEKNSRNSGLQQKLSSRDLYPSHYILGDMRITKDHIHFVDSPVAISVKSTELTKKAHSLKPRNFGGLYLANGKPNNLGDERVIYKGIPNAPTATYFGVISDEVGVGKQLETVPGKVSSLIKNDGILHHLVNGGREAALIKMKDNFERTVWYTRIGGSLAIIVGIYFFFNSFYSLLYRIPLVERLVNKGAFVGSLAIGTPIALIVIISGLMTHNPFSVAFPLIIIITIVTYFILRSKTTKKQANHMLKERL
ncbi:MAG: TMEM43 family protein, partial [Akkermansiaceae bacterium]